MSRTVAAHEGSRERNQSLRGAAENAKPVALRRIAGQLVQLIGDGEVEPALHVAADVLDRRHALNLPAIRLPKS